MRRLVRLAVGVVCAAAAFGSAATSPSLRLDLGDAAQVKSIGGEWRVREATVVDAEFPRAGADGQPAGAPARTRRLDPSMGERAFDEPGWERIEPDALDVRRGGGRLSFLWYRFTFTVPEAVAGVPTHGGTLRFGITVDDYAEIFANGELAYAAGMTGEGVIAGWNAPNAVVAAENVVPGQQVDLAVLGVNGPLAVAPTNYIYVRSAWLELVTSSPGPRAAPPTEVNVHVERLHPALDRIVPRNPKLYRVGLGFQFTEGPVWVRDRLLFSDPNANRIYAWYPQRGLEVFREQSGYAGADVAEYSQPGSNGLALDGQGRLTVNEHGNRRVSRTEADGSITVLADRVDGKRLNSPNDLVYTREGVLYFTDPPFGLPRFAADPRRELEVSGVYCVANGEVKLVAQDLAGPNGIALSPDEKFLYVGNWDPARKVVMRYPLLRDGSLGTGEVFHDMTKAPGPDAIDGIKVDTAGNLFVSGPGGVWILDSSGQHLGTIRAPRQVHNMAWGEDGRTLFLTAHDRLYRMPLLSSGAGFAQEAAR